VSLYDARYDVLPTERIRLIQPAGDGSIPIIVGHAGVERIEVVQENGQMARVPSVYGADDSLICMVNAAHVQQVDFYPPSPEEEVT
jgi:hypothetical protein